MNLLRKTITFFKIDQNIGRINQVDKSTLHAFSMTYIFIPKSYKLHFILNLRT